MTDDKIKEEFEKYLNGAIDTKATMFGYGYNTDRRRTLTDRVQALEMKQAETDKRLAKLEAKGQSGK